MRRRLNVLVQISNKMGLQKNTACLELLDAVSNLKSVNVLDC
jgi:hypothetical protein